MVQSDDLDYAVNAAWSGNDINTNLVRVGFARDGRFAPFARRRMPVNWANAPRN